MPRTQTALPVSPLPSDDPEAARVATLSRREREVVGLVGQGLSNPAIADRLCIAEATVRHHLTTIFAKLGVQNRLRLIVFAYRYGLATPTDADGQPGRR